MVVLVDVEGDGGQVSGSGIDGDLKWEHVIYVFSGLVSVPTGSRSQSPVSGVQAAGSSPGPPSVSGH